MFNFFKPKNQLIIDPSQIQNFEYLDPKAYYFDTACQSLRPQQVINAEMEYYHSFGACGGRVKYQWGKMVDQKVSECRTNLLKLAGKTSRDYTVAFGLNTTHLISLVLHQINPEKLGIKQIITSQIEHNSVFLSSLTWAKRNGLKRLVLPRIESGNYFGGLQYDTNNPIFLANSVIIVNTMSNIDGQELTNAEQLAQDVHQTGGILLLDACQTFGHNPEILKNVDFDAAFGSGHKMYGPSVGFVIIKKDLLKKLDCYLIGGSTVQDVKLESYELVENDEEIYARIEPGLQNFAGIIGLNEAIKWQDAFLKTNTEKQVRPWGLLRSSGGVLITNNKIENNLVKKIPPFVSLTAPKEALVINTSQNQNYEQRLTFYLNQKLLKIQDIHLLNPNPSPVVSLYSDKMDSHKIAMYLSEAGIMCRSGYHCCHYYLKEKMKYPPLLRISLGLHNTPEQIDFLVDKLEFILKNS